jgi:hypothetical protein
VCNDHDDGLGCMLEKDVEELGGTLDLQGGRQPQQPSTH